MILRQMLEVDLLAHCILRCAHCAVAAPYLQPHVYPLEQFQKDTGVLAQVLHLSQLRFVGGEPFLVANLTDYVQIARASGLADWIGITTNGILLDEIDPVLLASFDFIIVSFYHHLEETYKERIREGIEKVNALESTGISVKDVYNFRLTEVQNRHDTALTRMVWNECWQREKCSVLWEGSVYRCTMGERRRRYLASLGLGELPDEGCAIHEPELDVRLSSYFGRTELFEMCHYCWGCSSEEVPHRQMERA